MSDRGRFAGVARAVPRLVVGGWSRLACALWCVVPSLLLAAGMGARSNPMVEYPLAPVRIVVGFQPGGPTDVVARELAPRLQAAWGKPVLVENRPGASSRLAFELVARAEPNGHTLLLGSVQTATHMAVFPRLAFDTLRDFVPVSQLTSTTLALVASPTLGAKSLGEAIALARSRPGTVSYASFGVASSSHFAGALLERRAGLQMIHVPFAGAGPAQTAIVAGQVDIGFMSALSATSLMRAGKLRPLAVAGEARLAQMPEVPTMAEAGFPDFVVSSWQGLLAPRGTPPAVIDKVHREVVRVLSVPEVRERLAAVAAEPVGSSPAEFRALIESEISRWTGLAKHLNLALE